MSSESYLVIGGSGLLGGHIIDKLLERGETAVATFDIAPGTTLDKRVRVFVGDVCDRTTLDKVVKECGATCIFHTVALLQGKDDALVRRVNIEGTRTVISVAEAQRVSRLVYTSSASVVFAGPDQANVDESAPYPERPFDLYNETKALAEQAVLQANGRHGLSTTSLRVAAIFGPRDRLSVPTILGTILTGNTNVQIGSNQNLFDWTYIENAAHAHLLAADRLAPGHPKYQQVAGEAFFITNGEPRPYWDLPRALWREVGYTPKSVTVLPKSIAWLLALMLEIVCWVRGTDPLFTRYRVHMMCATRYCSIEKARKALDYEPPVPLDEGIRRSAQWWMLTHSEEMKKIRALR
ncbi:NAD(P)-binding protein [Phanerochaete sordida]|uniref:NAD(P)-binding protein n=1 Tax=Phanerochaete sordida TaxID=48140 RepID=A0A9P3GF37_9APHY|nr:NAD(P)-binding protein [Phanerochaete sordida]